MRSQQHYGWVACYFRRCLLTVILNVDISLRKIFNLIFFTRRIRRTSEEPTMNELMAAMVLSSLSCSPVFHNQPKGAYAFEVR